MAQLALPTEIDELWIALNHLPEFQNASYKNSFDGFLKKMEHIHSLNDVEKYRIVFIGEPGKGKTTAICNWLNLLCANKESKKRIEAVSLLATASGRTTVAEVHIHQCTEPSRLRIEYMPIPKQEEYIKEYFSYYYAKCFGPTEDVEDTFDESPNDTADVHLEIDRVIRNMASIDDVPSGKSDQSLKRRERILTFMRRFKNADDFYNYLLEKINLDNRQCTEVIYTGIEPYEDWLRKTFKDINDGKRSDCSIASKIFIDVCHRDLFLDLPPCVAEIIDTIGLDSSVRPDLQELMLSNDTICFLMDDLKNVPSPNVRNMIKSTFLSDWDAYYVKKTSIFVKSPDTELAAVNEADGDPEIGIEVKQNELARRIDADTIPYVMENSLFLDSCAAYVCRSEKVIEKDENGNPKINPVTGKTKVKMEQSIDRYEADVAFEYRQQVNNKIQCIIDALKQSLKKDATNIKNEVEKLLELERKFENADAESELIDVKQKINNKRPSMMPRFRGANVSEAILTKAIDNIHWRTIRKMNSLYGGYNMWHTDIYTQIMQAGRECFADVMRPVNTEIRQLLVDIRNEDARSITAGYSNQFELLIKNSTENIGKRFLTWALEEGFAPQSDLNPFWIQVNDICGRGYKSRVRDKYNEQIYDDTVMLAKMIIAEIDNDLNKLIALFPED